MHDKRRTGQRTKSPHFPDWLQSFLDAEDIELWGAADLSEFVTPKDESGLGFPAAISFAVPMGPVIMFGIQNGPNELYAAEYAAINTRINSLAESLAVKLRDRGFRALPLAASDRTDTKNIKGDFPHKTAATRAGLGWIGRHCQLVTFPYGPWLRLGTVFTNMVLPKGPPVEQDFCGKCNSCVEACPADALSGEKWHPGLPREDILNARACDDWKKEHYPQFHNGHNCGICAAVCPFGKKSLKRRQRGA
jgi:epoxyqueuosine reductase QueG